MCVYTISRVHLHHITVAILVAICIRPSFGYSRYSGLTLGMHTLARACQRPFICMCSMDPNYMSTITIGQCDTSNDSCRHVYNLAHAACNFGHIQASLKLKMQYPQRLSLAMAYHQHWYYVYIAASCTIARAP
jgi:hypothetical protein